MSNSYLKKMSDSDVQLIHEGDPHEVEIETVSFELHSGRLEDGNFDDFDGNIQVRFV